MVSTISSKETRTRKQKNTKSHRRLLDDSSIIYRRHRQHNSSKESERTRTRMPSTSWLDDLNVASPQHCIKCSDSNSNGLSVPKHSSCCWAPRHFIRYDAVLSSCSAIVSLLVQYSALLLPLRVMRPVDGVVIKVKFLVLVVSTVKSQFSRWATVVVVH